MRVWIYGCQSLSSRARFPNKRDTPGHLISRCVFPWTRSFVTSAPQWQTTVSPITLRPYQEECIQEVLRYLHNGEKRLGISLATGSGKTVIFSHLIDRVASPTPDATQTLILAHRRELVEQAAKHCRRLYPDKHVDIEMGKVEATGVADITVASIQSLIAGDRLSKFDPSRMKLVLVDEAHHAVAPTYLTVLEHFGLAGDRANSVSALVGVSATFSRPDGVRLGAAFDHIVFHKDYVDMMEAGALSQLRFTTVKSGADLSKVKTALGDYRTGSLSRAVNTPDTNELTVRSWLAIAKERKSTLVFCVDIDHVAAMTDTFRHHGYDARSVTSKTPTKVRAERVAAFKAGEFPVLVNCGIFTEGTDIPNIDCVLLARPTKSQNLLIQMMGRGLRLSEGKDDCHVIDMVASLAKGIVTTPTLFGLDPDELLDDTTGDTLKERRKQLEQSPENVFRRASADFSPEVAFTHFDSIEALLENTSGERHIRGMSRLAWVQVDSDRYILSTLSDDFLTLQLQDQEYVVTYTKKLDNVAKGKSPYMRPMTVATSPVFQHAINAADTFAMNKFTYQFIVLSAPWRRTPASSSQLAYLNKFRDESKQLQPGSISKGDAGAWITKIKHGARGRFKRLQKARADAEKKKEKAERETIRVGPVRKEGTGDARTSDEEGMVGRFKTWLASE